MLGPVLIGASLGVLLLARGTARTFSLSALVCPGCVAGIAQGLPYEEDAFILAAWDLAGSLAYEDVGSHLDFLDHRVRCESCLLPAEALGRGIANCVGHAAVLSSLLRNRLPPERVLMAVGQYTDRGTTGGHAWALVQREGTWYLLESVTRPGISPWLPAPAASRYMPLVLFNDQAVYCDSPTVCVDVSDCPCHERAV